MRCNWTRSDLALGRRIYSFQRDEEWSRAFSRARNSKRAMTGRHSLSCCFARSLSLSLSLSLSFCNFNYGDDDRGLALKCFQNEKNLSVKRGRRSRGAVDVTRWLFLPSVDSMPVRHEPSLSQSQIPIWTDDRVESRRSSWSLKQPTNPRVKTSTTSRPLPIDQCRPVSPDHSSQARSTASQGIGWIKEPDDGRN